MASAVMVISVPSSTPQPRKAFLPAEKEVERIRLFPLAPRNRKLTRLKAKEVAKVEAHHHRSLLLPINYDMIKDKRGTSPSGKKDAALCRSFMKGNCKYGKDCNFLHVTACRNFQSGECKAGAKCKFLHIDSKEKKAEPKVQRKLSRRRKPRFVESRILRCS